MIPHMLHTCCYPSQLLLPEVVRGLTPLSRPASRVWDSTRDHRGLCAHACVRACVTVCVRVCVCACDCVCDCVCVCSQTHAHAQT